MTVHCSVRWVVTADSAAAEIVIKIGTVAIPEGEEARIT